MISRLLLLTLLLFSGCTTVTKESVEKKEIEPMTLLRSNPTPPIRTVEVNAEEFFVDTSEVPENEVIKRVKILGAPLVDAVALLTEATEQNIVFQLQSEVSALNGQNSRYGSGVTGIARENYSEGGDEILTESNVYVSASNIGFGTLLKKAVGDKLSVHYEDNTYYLGHLKTVTLKIPAIKALGESLEKSLTTMGATSVVYDPITSSVTFSARKKEYAAIMNYLVVLRNNIYVIEYDMAIYSVDLKDNFSLGIDWNALPSIAETVGFVASATASVGTVGASETPYKFGLLLNSTGYSAEAMLNILEHFGRVESIQRPKLLGLAGTDVYLKDGLEEAYIKELQTTSVVNGTSQTSTVSDKVLSGLEITLNSNLMDETVVTDIALRINDIVGYSNFEVDNKKYFQPKVSTKEIRNIMRVQPGVPIVVSGLFRDKVDKGRKGIPGTAGSSANSLTGTDYNSRTKSEMVIIVTPRIIQYVMK